MMPPKVPITAPIGSHSVVRYCFINSIHFDSLPLLKDYFIPLLLFFVPCVLSLCTKLVYLACVLSLCT